MPDTKWNTRKPGTEPTLEEKREWSAGVDALFSSGSAEEKTDVFKQLATAVVQFHSCMETTKRDKRVFWIVFVSILCIRR